MALFGGSKSTTSQSSLQQGIEASDQAVSLIGGSGAQSYAYSRVDEFPEAVANFAEQALELAKNTVTAAIGSAASTQDSLATIAEREKTPLTEWLPIVAVGAVALIGLAYFTRG
jgi:hypothetical protein